MIIHYFIKCIMCLKCVDISGYSHVNTSLLVYNNNNNAINNNGIVISKYQIPYLFNRKQC